MEMQSVFVSLTRRVLFPRDAQKGWIHVAN